MELVTNAVIINPQGIAVATLSWRVSAFVTGIVVLIISMTFYPMPGNRKVFRQYEQFLPKLFIFYRLSCGIMPALFKPAVNPLRNTFLYILGVGIDFDI